MAVFNVNAGFFYVCCFFVRCENSSVVSASSLRLKKSEKHKSTKVHESHDLKDSRSFLPAFWIFLVINGDAAAHGCLDASGLTWLFPFRPFAAAFITTSSAHRQQAGRRAQCDRPDKRRSWPFDHPPGDEAALATGSRSVFDLTTTLRGEALYEGLLYNVSRRQKGHSDKFIRLCDTCYKRS